MAPWAGWLSVSQRPLQIVPPMCAYKGIKNQGSIQRAGGNWGYGLAP